MTSIPPNQSQRTPNKTTNFRQSNSRSPTKASENFRPSVARSMDCSIQVKIGSHKLLALVDSGASKSIIHSKVVKYLNNQTIRPCADALNLLTANGDELQISGVVASTVKVNGLLLDFDFLIASSLVHNLILGADFLTEHGAVVDFKHHLVSFVDNTTAVPIISSLSRLKLPTVSLLKCCQLAPMTETLLPVRIPRSYQEQVSIIEPLTHFNSQPFLVAAALVTPTRHRTFCRVLNPTNETVALPKDLIIASIQPASSVHELELDTQASAATSGELTAESFADLGIDLSGVDLDSDQKAKFFKLLHENRSIFAKDLSDLEGTDLVLHRIETTGPPVRQRCYRHTAEAREEINRQIQDMLRHNIISPSDSAWSSPVILCKKKSGDFRFVVDYRLLNSQTELTSQVLPVLEDVLDALASSKPKYMTTLDMKNGFFQIKLDPETSHKSGFNSSTGNYSFNRLSQGLSNAPATFQALMHTVFRGDLWKFVLVYVDDILVYSPTFDDHMRHLGEVFRKLRNAKLKLHPQKCTFFSTSVKFLGHILTSTGVQVDEAKIQKVRDFPVPKNQRQLKQCLGFFNYYRRFCKNFAKVAHPLNELLRKDVAFVWTESCQTAFEALKEALIQAPLLYYPNMNAQFRISCDGSTQGIGYILSQIDSSGVEVPIHFGSRNLRPNERKWSVTDIECAALVQAIREFHPYVAGTSFVVISDHISLKYLKSIKASTTSRLCRWSLLLQHYNFTVEFRPGRKHQAPDALSRMDDQPDPPPVPESDDYFNDDAFVRSVNTTGTINAIDFEYDVTPDEADAQQTVSLDDLDCMVEPNLQLVDLAAQQKQCIDFKSIIDYLTDGSLPDDDKVARKTIMQAEQYVIDDGLLYHLYSPRVKNMNKARPVIKQLAIPRTMRNDIMVGYHDNNGHAGFDRLYASIRDKYFWPLQYLDSQDFTRTCPQCQQAKRPTVPNKAVLHPLPTNELFHTWSMDFCGPIAPSSGPGRQKFILLLVEHLSGWAEAFPLASTEASVVADVLYNRVFSTFGAPLRILTDRGSNFVSALVSELCKLFKVKRSLTSSYHPCTNSKAERTNSYLWQAFRACCDKYENWAEYLTPILMAYRSTVSVSASGFSPYFVLFGKPMRLPIDNAVAPPTPTGKITADKYMEQMLPKLELTRKLAQENIERYKNSYKERYDQTARPFVYTPGTQVWLHDPKTVRGLSNKLRRKWIGPYFITLTGPNDTYWLRRCSDNRMHPSIVHSNRLKPYYSDRDALMSRWSQNTPVHNNGDSQDDRVLQQQLDAGSQGPADDVPGAADGGAPGPMDRDPVAVDTPTVANKPNPDEWFEVTRLLACKKINGTKHYKVKWADPTAKDSWEPENFVSDNLKREFHVHKTWQGRRRKRQRQV